MTSFEFLAIVLTGLGLTASIIYYSMHLRNQNIARKAQIQSDKNRRALDLINKQIEFYADLEGRLDEDDLRKITNPMSFIEEKFNQANVRTKYNDLALERAQVNILKFYNGGVMSHEDQLDLFDDLQMAVLQDLNELKKKREELVEK
ncbi:hypothetical protein ACFL0D_03970 [Thermoproteota archaeon]